MSTDATRADWDSAAEKALRGRPLSSLTTTTLDGINREPLYTRDPHSQSRDEAGLPGANSFTRGPSASSNVMGWEIRQTHDVRRPEANLNILDDLEKGVTAVTLVGSPTDGATLERILEGVLLDLAPIHLEAGASAAQADALIGVWASRNTTPEAALGSLGQDPLGALARHGALETSADEALSALGSLAAQIHLSHPRITSAVADGRPYGGAGASESQEIASVLATGVAYLRAMTQAGLNINDAARQVTLTLSIGPDQFMAVAKLRATRRAWARILEVSGAAPASRAASIHAETAAAMVTRRDPWVNILRSTMAGFAASVGGADAITVRPFDSALGASDDLGMRVARNTQLMLDEESHVNAVIDPAGGSWYVEELTTELANESWVRFQAIEAQGGMASALVSGFVQEAIAEIREQRMRDLATRRSPVTGVSEFPDIEETPLERNPLTANTRAIAQPGETCEPLPSFRWAEPYEDLRDAAQMRDPELDPPVIFLANLGPIATHTARATFAKNFFETGGITALSSEGTENPADVAAAFTESRAAIACICSSDALYGELAADTAEGLKVAGAQWVVLAGAPGDDEAVLREAGVDEFIHVGCDVLATLRSTHDLLGL